MLDATGYAVMTQIYSAAVDPLLWPEAMDGVAQHCDAKAAALLIRHPYAHQPDFQALSSTLDHASRSPFGMLFGVRQGQVYSGDWNKLRHVIPGQIYVDNELGHSSHFLDSRSDYRFLKRKLGTGRRVGVRLSEDNAWFEAFGIGLPENQSQMTRKTRQSMQQLIPHLVKATELARLYMLLRSKHGGVFSALSQVAAGVAIARPTGEVIYANPEARRILDHEKALRQTENGYLRCRAPRQTARLHAAIVEATHTAAGTALFKPYQMDIESADGASPILCDIAPLNGLDAEMDTEAEAALLLLLDPSACSYLDIARFALSYGLNPMETDMCEALVNGQTTDQFVPRSEAEQPDFQKHGAKLLRTIGVADQHALLRRVWRVAPVVH